ncbi:MAG: hypothetical protein KAJ51_07220 [Thermoplasmata archaeon]|nr:hypothetical protein [Thermoplasmata archaeon]
MKNSIPEKRQKSSLSQQLSKSEKFCLIILIIIIIFFVIFTYTWIPTDHPTRPPQLESIVAELEQGDGNMSSGCLFVLIKGKGSSVNIEDYYIKVNKKGQMPITLKWPEDGNITHYSTSSYIVDEYEWWDFYEVMGFDAPPQLRKQNITDGEIIEVKIVHIETNTLVFKDEFIYQD